MLDDATNVHGSYVRVTGITAPDQVIARINHPQQAGYEFAGKGDEIDVVDAETLLAKHTLRVKKSERINAHYIQLTFTAPVESRLTVGDGLENMSWYPELIFRNNVVRNNRARSILVSTPRKVVVEGNTFSSMMSAILFEGDMDHWYESGAVRDVTIRNNRFLTAHTAAPISRRSSSTRTRKKRFRAIPTNATSPSKAICSGPSTSSCSGRNPSED